MILDRIEVGLWLKHRKSPPHVHPCPGCYTDWPCGMDCTMQGDLECDNGMPSGSYVLCELCVKAGVDPDTLERPNQERR